MHLAGHDRSSSTSCGRDAAALAWFASNATGAKACPSYRLTELYAGSSAARQEEQRSRPARAIGATAAVDRDIAVRAGVFVRHLRPKSFGIDDPDALIAATAEHHGLRLATLNVKHFPMFPKLKRAY